MTNVTRICHARSRGISMFVTRAFAIVVLCLVPVVCSATNKTEPDYQFEQVAVINQRIQQLWAEYEIKPSESADDGEWCRRTFLDLIGRIPSIDELKQFLGDRSPIRKQRLVDMLLFDEKYIEEYARNWTTIWTNLLIGRNGGTERRSLTNREGLQKYLRDSFARNKPYDHMVVELVTAKGTNSPGEDNFNGAVNYLVMKLDEGAVQATAQTARLFLGTQVQCTQCHNHPFNDWKQNQFWELNAFFRQAVALRRFVRGTNEIRNVELDDQDFAGDGAAPDPNEAEIYYELRNALNKVAYPVFVDGTEVRKKNGEANRSGFVSDFNRRAELGRLIAESTFIQEAIVNRMWGHFFGYGFTNPVDDMGPHNPPSHPELLTYLGQQMRESSFDLKQLMRWMVLSEAYSLSSRTNSSNHSDDPLLGEPPKFSHFYLRQMRAEELYESLLVATEAHKTKGTYQEQEKTKREWLRQFTIAFGTDEGDETTTFNGTIPQTLMMFNGELTKRATNADKGGFLSRVASHQMSTSEKIDYLFLAALSRSANKTEKQMARQLMVVHRGDSRSVLQDFWWAVLNSNEFILNH